MPAYFYHFAFELCPPDSRSARSLPELSGLSDLQLQALPVWIPEPGSNIFAALPPHTPSSIPRNPESAAQSSKKRGKEKSKEKKEAPKDRDEAVPPTPSTEKAIASTPSNHKHLDWRFGRVTVDSIDMAPASSLSVPAGKAKATAPLVGDTTTKAHFVPLKSKTTEFGYGVVHFYRDKSETPGLAPLPAKSDSEEQNVEVEDEEALTTVAVLAVPSYMTPSDFMGFVREENRDAVSHLRMIRTGTVNRYMVLMKFRQKEDARTFVKEFNGKLFNSMEPENCHVVFVKSIKFQPPSSTSALSDKPSAAFPEISNDPFSPSHTPEIPGSSVDASTVSVPASAAHISVKPAPPPTPSLLELPTCPVCLERMDETTGLLTILCQHVFHCACLSKWKDSSCPVCRYTQSDNIRGSLEYASDEAESCGVCGADSNLWICLICGNVGCGRYDSAHAFDHYHTTSHCYAMDVSSQRVWDYSSDGYVHRLIQNQSDGKLVELPSALSNSYHPQDGSGDYVPREKLDNIGMEYTYLLTSQLESQRQYFEEKVALSADKASTAALAAESAFAHSQKLLSELAALKSTHQTLVGEMLPSLERDKTRAEKKAQKFGEMARNLEKEWKEEKGVSGALMQKIDFLQKQDEERRKENEELKEQIRDLMFFLEAREKMKGADEEIAEGTVTVGDAPPLKADGKRKKGKGRR